MKPSSKKYIVDLVHAGLTGESKRVELAAISLARSIKKESPDISKSINQAISSFSLSGASAIRNIGTSPLPVDNDTQLHMANIFKPNKSQNLPPILNNEISERISSFLDERNKILSKISDLILEKLSYLSEQSKLQRQHEEAVADKDRAQAAIIKAQIAQNAAQLNLVESKLSRTKMLAPFDGFVVSGDLSQRLGSALEQGEVLFEVAPLDQYRVILWVDEHKMADVIEGQTGRLILNALPEDIFEFKLTQVTPVTEARDGANLFRVEAALSGPTINLRPGMKGIGKIQIDQRKLIWIWTYPLQQWVRLKVWAWWP